MADAAGDDDAPRGDKFYRGTIKSLFSGSGMGVVCSASGRDIPFAFMHVLLIGPVRSCEDLRQGMKVGFDVGWTADGLRITVLRADD